VTDDHIREIAKPEAQKVLKNWGEEAKTDVKEYVLTRSEDIIRKTAEKIFKDEASRTIFLKPSDGKRITLKSAHKQTPDLAEFINARINVYVYGPAGTGKTHTILQITKALGMTPYMVSGNPFMSTHDHLGFMNAMGKYVPTALYRFLTDTNPSTLFIDEFDRQRVDAPSVLNSLLAQGHITFPNGETLHLRTDGTQLIIASGNTAMRGGTTAYAAASKQERSTIDRFCYLYWAIDENLESAIGQQINATHAPAWIAWIRTIRAWYEKPENRNMQDDAPTPRSVYDGLKLLATTSLPVETVADATFFKGMAPDIRAKILQFAPMPRIVRTRTA